MPVFLEVYRRVSFARWVLAAFACMASAAGLFGQIGSGISNTVLLDTENPDIREIASFLGQVEVENNLDILHSRNRRGVFQSLGLTVLGVEYTGANVISDRGFNTLTPPASREPWTIADLDPAIGGDLFLLNFGYFQKLPGGFVGTDLGWSFERANIGTTWEHMHLSFSHGLSEDWKLSEYQSLLNFPSLGTDTSTELYKRFAFPKTYSDLSEGEDDGSTLYDEYANLDPNATKLVVVVHGWQPKSVHDPYAENELAVLVRNIHEKMESAEWYTKFSFGTDWDLYAYNWAADAATGGNLLLLNIDIADAGGLGTAVENGVEAAEIGYQHGLVLGKLLREDHPSLKKIHFIAHSAGTWVARSASLYLEATKGDQELEQQITLLDPFNPEVGLEDWDSPVSNHSVSHLGTSDIDSWALQLSLGTFENIYSDDEEVTGTNEVYWGGSEDGEYELSEVANVLVGDSKFGGPSSGRLDGTRWGGHGGPISFYAYTVDPSDPETRAPFLSLSLFLGESDGYVKEATEGPRNASLAGWGQGLYQGELGEWAESQDWHDSYLATENSQYLYQQGTAIPSQVGKQRTSADEETAAYSSIAVDARNGFVTLVLVPSGGGPLEFSSTMELQFDGTFEGTLLGGQTVSGQYDFAVAPPTLSLEIDDQSLLENPSRVEGDLPYAGFSVSFDEEQSLGMISLLLKDGTALVGVSGKHPNGEPWVASALGTVDESGNLSASNSFGFAIEVPLSEGGQAQLQAGTVEPLPTVEPINEATDFEGWISRYSSIPSYLRGPEDDPDLDGLANLSEYFHGLSPLESRRGAETLVAASGVSASGFKWRLVRSKFSIGLRSRFQWSADAMTWHESGESSGTRTVTLDPSIIESDATTETIEVIVESDEPFGEAIFVRLAIQQDEAIAE